MHQKKIFLFPILISLLLFSSCLNRYERDIIGTYEVGEYELSDSSKPLTTDLPKITLKEDKTFLLYVENVRVEGKWKADDYGDWTIVNFFFNGKDVQGIVGMDAIEILNPYEFNSPFLKTLQFTKVKPEIPAKN